MSSTNVVAEQLHEAVSPRKDPEQKSVECLESPRKRRLREDETLEIVKKKMRCDASQESVPEDSTTNAEEVDEDNDGVSDKNAKEAGEEEIVVEVEDSGPKKVGEEQPVMDVESGEDVEAKKVGGGQPVAEVASNEASLEVREPGDEQPVVDSAVDEGFEDDHTLVDAMDAASEAGGHQAGTEVNDDNEPECPSGTSVGEA